MEYHEGTIVLTETKENKIIKYRLNGYPECCIKAMIEEKAIGLVINKKINKTSLKPCVNHAIQIIEGEITLSDLITDTRTSFLEPFKEVWEKHSSFVDTKIEKLYEKSKKRRSTENCYT